MSRMIAIRVPPPSPSAARSAPSAARHDWRNWTAVVDVKGWLESVAATGSLAGSTDLFLRRGHRFVNVDLLLTNFHQPRSTLLVLVDAFVGARWRDLYDVALAEGYRFLSFGDAMLIL